LFGRHDQVPAGGESLLERGIVDSTGILELVGFLERQYCLVVEDRELLPANLDSIDRLVAFVKRKTGAGSDASAD
jgi:acyl carrier protein